MEAIGAASSVIAVIQITAQIAQLCGGYISDVHNAPQEVESMRTKISSLHDVVQQLQKLIEDAEDGVMPLSFSLLKSIEDCEKNLAALQSKLSPSKREKAMSKFGFRALKWPFSTREMQKALTSLEEYLDIFSRALQVDHM